MSLVLLFNQPATVAPPAPVDSSGGGVFRDGKLALDEVQKSWDLLEIRLRNQAAPKVVAAEPVAAVSRPLELAPATGATLGYPEAANPLHLARITANLMAEQSIAIALAAAKKRQADEEAFILLLCDEC